MIKRKIEDDCQGSKKNVSEELQQMYSTSNEWPVYGHPDGGLIKITPWGSIRQFEVNGEMVTKFEDMTFQDYDFAPAQNKTLTPAPSMNNMNGSQAQDVSMELPGTPLSIQLSPSDEAEGYVVQGYEDQFAREHENYFGTIDDEDTTM